MSFRVCLSCGELWYGSPQACSECGSDLLALTRSFRGAMQLARGIMRDRNLSADDRDTVGEVCAAYNRLEARVDALEARARFYSGNAA